MRRIVRDLLQRFLGRQGLYHVLITYEYTSATDKLEASFQLKALDEYEAVRAALLHDRNSPHGAESGWKNMHVQVKFLGYR